VKIRRVRANNRQRAFEVETGRRTLHMPYARVSPTPSANDRVARVYIDPELGREAFTYELESGREGSVHVDALLEEHRDPAYMADLLAHELAVEARRRLASTHLSRREICRRLGTSAAQLYRLLDETNGSVSLRQLLALLDVLGCSVGWRTTDAARNGTRGRTQRRATHGARGG
jgi:DNA-binding TFAR19-related protein (PDSD5 family)